MRAIDERDSNIPTRYVKAYGYRRGHYDARTGLASCVIIHTTGFNLIKRWRRQGFKHDEATPFMTALRVFSHGISGAKGRAAPHYVVGTNGEVAQMCPESVQAWHTGGSYSRAYRGPDWSRWQRKRFNWWHQRFPHLHGPADLAHGTLWDTSPNDASIGIEVVPNIEGRRHGWDHEVWHKLGLLVSDICDRHGIPKDADHIFTHSDANPKTRTTLLSGKPWDPLPTQWNWHQMAAALGV